MRYLPNSAADRQAMLRATGHAHIDELFAQIPADLRFKGKLNLPGPLSEAEILEFFQQAAAESSREYVSLLGAGAYSHYRPVVVDALLSRGEFFTAYTPYQAEIAQGTLQAMFEFQTMMTQLTGQEVSNASLYDGSTATTEAALMALRVTRRRRVVLARTLHPEYRQVLQDLRPPPGCGTGGSPLREPPDKLTRPNSNPPWMPRPPPWWSSHRISSALWSASRRLPPSPTGRARSLIVTVTEPLSLAIVKPPSEADIVCGEAQSFGVPGGFRRSLRGLPDHPGKVPSADAGPPGGPDR